MHVNYIPSLPFLPGTVAHSSSGVVALPSTTRRTATSELQAMDMRHGPGAAMEARMRLSVRRSPPERIQLLSIFSLVWIWCRR
ncbi:hypothetical protein BDA96_06G272500 [Sorghum bicolor]|uniref:Uncharacterized protein n=2 Tax=Sorghum bicolor TaxID=4558 RepID=A0A921UDE0_SORBI|nr:hypothetical protein BDA96_06G272500 [Sorghum bicolor]OQU82491.1 hypothetical protein SORBI_3006G249050 [Sorghum bicolor]